MRFQTSNCVRAVSLKNFHANLASNGMSYQSKLGGSGNQFFQQCNFVLYLVFQVVGGSWKIIDQFGFIQPKQWLMESDSIDLWAVWGESGCRDQRRRNSISRVLHHQDILRELSWSPGTWLPSQGYLRVLLWYWGRMEKQAPGITTIRFCPSRVVRESSTLWPRVRTLDCVVIESTQELLMSVIFTWIIGQMDRIWNVSKWLVELTEPKRLFILLNDIYWILTII